MRRKTTATIVARRNLRQRLGMFLSVFAMMFGIFFLLWILYTLTVNGIGALNWAIFTETTPAPGNDGGGLMNALVGTVLMVLVTTAITTPVGIMAGMYLAEYGETSWFGRITRFTVDIMLSAPSIVIGLFIYAVYVANAGHFSGWAGSFALSLIALPVIVRTTDNFLNLVPESLREAAFALGAPRWRVATMVRLKAVKAGVLTGVLLAVARISGETAPLLFTALNNQFFSANMNAPMANLPVVIYQFAMSPYDNWRELAWGGAFIITLGVLGLNILSRVVFARKAANLGNKEKNMKCDMAMNGQGTDKDNGGMAMSLMAGIGEKQDLEEAGQEAKKSLDIRNLNFYYGDFQGLKNVNLPIHEKKVTAFIGPSGCGKSTLLRTMNRMYDLYPKQRAEGQILFNGKNILDPDVDVNTLRARIGMVFQKPTPFPMTIYENIAFGVRLYEDLSKGEMDERVEWALKKAALWNEVKDKLDKSGQSLSGGQQQRLCIARCVAVKPEVLLLDEPTSALDPISTAKVEELISELKDDYTIAIVTHNMQQGARCSDYTAYMYLGQLVEFGKTEQIFMQPEKKETQDYITGRFG